MPNQNNNLKKNLPSEKNKIDKFLMPTNGKNPTPKERKKL